ncbi:hypothetical protein BPTFM16_01562 [Altererythrobacter insulae]|nr:hypothetical protein BPTFM16_01562 [Altererythrobacter insulae]
MPKIVLINVKYSPNLGDGIIAECLEAEIARLHPEVTVESLDLAGRETFGVGLDEKRGTVLRILNQLPSLIRRLAIFIVLSILIRFRYQKVWNRVLDAADGAVLGGGQIIADADLNFPLKINAALRTVDKADTPIAIFGVGVAAHMSRTGQSLFARSFANSTLTSVAVRDLQSQENWSALFEEEVGKPAELCLDPGFLACDRYDVGPTPAASRVPTIGLGILNPSVLALHSDLDESHLQTSLRSFWIDLVEELQKRGIEPVLFTNGPADDEAFAHSIAQESNLSGLRIAARPRIPSELAAIIGSFDAVAAHRLHATIIAYSFRIPHVGLRWDPKMTAFMHSVGREDWLANADVREVGNVAEMLENSLGSEIDAKKHAEILQSARRSIEHCTNRLLGPTPV